MHSAVRRGLARGVNIVGNLALRPPLGGQPFFRNHGSRADRAVALTFDDGPSAPSTVELLDALGALDVRATFFCVGVNVEQHPEIVARADAEGHVLGNHSMHHSRAAGLRLRGGAHIDEGAAALTRVLGRRPLLYRPPWGWLTPWEGLRLTRRGYTAVGWDVFTLDWQLPEPDGRQMAAQASRQTHPGSIILFHDGVPAAATWHKTETVRAVQQLVPALRHAGYTFVTIPELLGVAAYAPAHTTEDFGRGTESHSHQPTGDRRSDRPDAAVATLHHDG